MNYAPSTRAKLRIVLDTYRVLGFWETIRGILVYALVTPHADDAFDKKYGVSTTGQVETHEAEIPDLAAATDAVRYVPTDERVMKHILDRSLEGLDARTFSFVDLGCGKGRALIMAAQYPFKKVVGVELSPVHARDAAENVKRFLASAHRPRCRELEVVRANALDFSLPEGDLLVYLYNPFMGAVLRGVIAKIAESARPGRRIRVAYLGPEGELVLRRHPSFTCVREYQVIQTFGCWNLWDCHPPADAARTA